MKNKILLFFAFALLFVQLASGIDLSHYASESRLASGRWVKVSVPASGLYMISNSQLKQWGFADPARVRVYGYGGNRLPDLLNADTYIDDLPMVQSEATDKGIVFYGVGPERWVQTPNGMYAQSINIYSTAGYYFLSDTGEEQRPIPSQGVGVPSGNAATHFYDRKHYEYDRISPGEAGYLLVGESFKSQSSRKFTFDASADSIFMECAIVSNSTTASSVEFMANGQTLQSNNSDKIPTTLASGYLHGTFSTAFHKFLHTAQKLELTVTVRNAASMKDCWLDYIAINYRKELAMPAAGYMAFWTGASAKLKAGNITGLRIWDITNPLEITSLNAGNENGAYVWTNDYTGQRSYVAWSPAATLPAPDYAGVVPNQNIHGMTPVDMVIFTLPEYAAQAERIAQMHRTAVDPLTVEVLNVNSVYNEFGSGSADVGAIRKCLKMLYDRGMGADSVATVKYALLFGRATYDNRHLTSQFDGSAAHGTIPFWMGGERRQQLSDNTAFGTDDFIAMLDDDSGTSMGMDRLRVAVGRMPARTVDEARNAVDKLYQYVQKSKAGTWKNSYLFLADDGNKGIHVEQTEAMIDNLLGTPGSQAFVSKVYVDAYDIVGGSCVGGRNDMYRMLDEGTLWWSYCGHANNHSWTGENMLNYNDINNLYLTKVPILMAATCDFLRWDSNTLSGGEIFFHERYGGTIATISATRPVYITDNGYFTSAVGRALNARDENNRLPRLGDVYRNTKNDIRQEDGKLISNTNRLRFVLMGDPAMQLAMPSNIVRLDSIGGASVTPDEQVTIMALQRTLAKGSILSPDGKLLDDFNGTVEINIYDAERSITTKGRGDDNINYTFEQHGDKLFAGSAPVVNGRFEIKISMPGEVADNFRPATMNMYAAAANAPVEAVGVNRDFFVYGLDETVPADTVSPVIDSFILNADSFKPGATVNTSPMVIAKIRDDVGINLSTAGVGHQMTLTLDDTRTYTNVALFFTPASDGSPSGTISYPLENLTEGEHTLRLRIWDTNGNSASQEIAFNVREGIAPTIFEIRTDANPASVEANFYVTHDRPDGMMSVTIEVYNLLGHKLWSSTVNGRSDMAQSAPVTWNLCDYSGRRVQRGIYLYRATITDDNGQTYDTGSRKLAVTAQ